VKSPSEADVATDKAVEALRRMILDPRTGPVLRARLQQALVRHGRRAG
jgi:hypothetical protein